MTQLSLNHNDFSGPLPEWDAPSLAYLNLANLPLNVSIPDGWWERMPALAIVDLSECGLRHSPAASAADGGESVWRRTDGRAERTE